MNDYTDLRTMDKPDVSPDEKSNSTTEETSDTNYELGTSCHTEYRETSELFSQELFDADETNLTPNSSASSVVCELSETAKGGNESSQSDLLLFTPIQTTKIFNQDRRSSSRAIVPKVPTSLVPFISTVNESWTSDLETPNAETAASKRTTGSLLNEEFNDHPKSRESLRRNRCESVRSSASLSGATTPNGCFVAQMDDTGFSTSPILQTIVNRQRPKRRILKSLDTNASTNCLMDLTNVVEPTVKKYESKLDENIDFGTENNSRINDDSIAGGRGTIFTDENSSLLNSRIQVERDEASILPQKTDKRVVKDLSVVYSLSVINPEKDETNTVLIDAGYKCDDKPDEKLNEMNKKSFGDRLREMLKLRKNKPQFAEDKYVRMPIEFFTKKAAALESAQMSPQISTVKKCEKSDAKHEWGLISFTQMCLLEKSSEGIESSRQTVNNPNNDPGIRVSKDSQIKSGPPAMSVEKDEGDIAKILASSMYKDEAVIDVDEFSPWFYQSDEIKSDLSKYAEIAERSSPETSFRKAEGGLETTMKEKYETSNKVNRSSCFVASEGKLFATSRGGIVDNRGNELEKMLPEASSGSHRRKDEDNKGFIPEVSSYSSIGFSTACGKPIKVSEDKIMQAKRLYDEIATRDGNNCDFKFPNEIAGSKDYQRNENNNKNNNKSTGRTAISENSYAMTGFSTAGGKPIEISEEKLKHAEELYGKISAEVGDNFAENSSSFTASSGVFTARGVKRKQESYKPCEVDLAVDFTVAHGQPLELSETAMKKAKLMFDNDDDNSCNEIARSKKSPESKYEPKVILFAAEPESTYSKPGNLFSGFTTAGGKSLSMSKSALQRAERMHKDVFDVLDAADAGGVAATRSKNADQELSINLDDNLSNKGKCNTAVKDEAFKAFVGNENSVGKHESPIGRIPTGFSTASGIAIGVSDAAISKAKILLAEEGINCDSNSLNERGNKQKLAIEQENTTANNSSLKRSISQAIEISTKAYVSMSTTPGFGSPFENANAKTQNTGSACQKTKKPRLSYDLQGRKLFSETGSCDTDKEAEKVAKSDIGKSEAGQVPVSSIADRAQQLLMHEQRKQNNISAMYANSEMFRTTDRLVIPKLKPQMSSPLITRNLHHHLRSSEAQNEEFPSFFDEITASTEALLADEENANDRNLWASAMTCGPITTEEREISVRPIILREDGNAILEAPQSPVLGNQFRRLRKKKRRNRKGMLMKNALAVEAETNDRINRKDIIDEQTNPLGFQQSDTISLTSGSSKELHGSNSSQEAQEALADLLENRIAAMLEQEKIIRAKKKLKPKPVPGSLYLRKTSRKESRVSLRDLTNGIPPTARTPEELIDLGIGSDALQITAANAARYRLKCADFRSFNGEKIRADACWLDVGDGARLILDENGFAGAEEFERAFIASPNVDSNLVSRGWVENHYRWIVWKLASMDRMKLGENRMLTPDHIMKQLKYRYDREIDRSQRSALRRIIEKDDPACRRMILCVANLTKISNDQSPESNSSKIAITTGWKVLLTDGWYSIAASVDAAMEHFISSGKVRVGTKLVTCGAELLNCDQGFSPLEVPAEVSLKIHCNSTRRARWHTKLGYCRNASPIPTRLSAVLPYGGLIGKLDTIIARLYPIQYSEKTPSGQMIFRNEKCEDKAAMIYEEKRQAQINAIYSKARDDFESRSWKDSEVSNIESFRNEVESILQRSLPPPRKVTPVLKARVIEGENIASLTIWAPSEDVIDILKEGNRVSIHNLQSSGRRLGELHLTVGRQSFVKYEEPAHDYPRRCFTQMNRVAAAGFNPLFGDFDTVGVVVSFGTAPHGMKNFEVINLAFPNSDSSSSAYLSILFWEGIAAYGFLEILTVGSTVACVNLQWRRGPPRTIPIAYSTEYSTFTQNPRQAYLRSAFEHIKAQITDLPSYTAQCAAEIAIENERKTIGVRSPAIHGSPSKTSPHSASVNELLTAAAGANQPTPQGAAINTREMITPAKYSIQRRLEKLQCYGEPPNLSPIIINHDSIRVNQKFVSPLRTPEKRN